MLCEAMSKRTADGLAYGTVRYGTVRYSLAPTARRASGLETLTLGLTRVLPVLLLETEIARSATTLNAFLAVGRGAVVQPL